MAELKKERHTLAVLVDNAAGVLSQVSRLFSRKGYNIESLAVGATDNPAVSRITVEVIADEEQISLLCNQLNKQFPVHSVKRLSPSHSIRRELVLIKVKAESPDARNEIMQIASIFRSSIIDVSAQSLTVAVIGEEEKVFAIQDLLAPHGILELVRTGIVALERGSFTIDEATKQKLEYDYAKASLW